MVDPILVYRLEMGGEIYPLTGPRPALVEGTSLGDSVRSERRERVGAVGLSIFAAKNREPVGALIFEFRIELPNHMIELYGGFYMF